MHKSGKLGPSSIYYAPVQLITQEIARFLLQRSSHYLYLPVTSQHIKGDDNVISDLLSFAGKVRGYVIPPSARHPIPDATLTQRFQPRPPPVPVSDSHIRLHHPFASQQDFLIVIWVRK
jgi:hypothetical protein